MDKDEIIEMANQSQLFLSIWIDDEGDEIASLVAFVKLVEDAAFKRWVAQTMLAVQDEREACAKVCEKMRDAWVNRPVPLLGYAVEHDGAAKAIRARS
jgi:hypothetical protein